MALLWKDIDINLNSEGDYLIFDIDDEAGNEVKVKAEQVRFFIKIYQEATHTNFLADFVKGQIYQRDGVNRLPRRPSELLYHGCCGSWDKDMDYVAIAEKAVNFCWDDDGSGNGAEDGNQCKLKAKEHIARAVSNGLVYHQRNCMLPLGLHSMFTHFATGTSKVKEEDNVWIWPEAGPCVSNYMDYELFYSTSSEDLGYYQKVVNQDNSGTILGSCITPYMIRLYGSEGAPKDSILVKRNISTAAVGVTQDNDMSFENQPTFEELDKLCYLLLVSHLVSEVVNWIESLIPDKQRDE